MDAAVDKPPKSILKKPIRDPAAAGHEAGANGRAATYSRRQRTEEDNAEIARKHAEILQQRRELETAIFLDIERLTDFPLERAPPYSSAHPAPSDAAAFCRLVRTFQPGDYDDLIEERNTCGLCGYALCAKPRKTFAGGGTWKLVNAGRRDFGIVAKGELEKWCSQACARRALYIKVQLNETAAWERVGIPDIEVELLPEDDDGRAQEASVPAQTPEAQLARDLVRLKLHEERRLAKDQAALAAERGDAVLDGDDPAAAAQSAVQPKAALMDVEIYEKPITSAPAEPSLAGNGAAGDVEGHKIKFVEP